MIGGFVTRGACFLMALIHPELSRTVVGAFFAVHSQLGFGFLEGVYEKALIVLLTNAGLSVKRQVPFEIMFHGQRVGLYRADILVESKIVVEVKTGGPITRAQTAQLINYLKASRLQLGLLLNFGESAQFKRVVWTEHP